MCTAPRRPGSGDRAIESQRLLRRWIIKNDWREDAENAEFYLETALEMVRQTKLRKGGTEYPDAFAMWARRLLAESHFKVLGGGASYTIKGIELGMHGDSRPNGARGSLKNLRRIGVRSITGHGHSPGIDEGAYRTGASTLLHLEYTHGPSSWLNTHCAVYASGKRSLISIIKGRYRA